MATDYDDDGYDVDEEPYRILIVYRLSECFICSTVVY